MNEFDPRGFGDRESRNSFETALPAAIQGLASAMLRCNMEFMSLASRRMRANMDVPRQLSACKTATDVGQLQMEYWQALWQDYTQYGQRVASVCATCLQPANGADRSEMANPVGAFFDAMTRPFTQTLESMREAGEPGGAAWQWWRTDLKGLKPRRNGVAGEHAHDDSSHS